MKNALTAAALLALSLDVVAAKEECEDAVDLADSLDFQAMHIDCSDDPVTVYDPKSGASFLPNKKVVNAYESPSTKNHTEANQKGIAVVKPGVDAVKTEAATDKKSDNAGVTFNIREPFTITGGPQSALNGLYVQMAQYCSQGWTKNKEWVEPAPTGYYLHYQFQCAE